MSSPSVGGQAVIEGVMMKAPNRLCVALRKPDGEILIKSDPFRSLAEKYKVLGWPFLRGPVVLGETLIHGMKALTFSANQALEEEGEDLGGWEMALTMIVAIGAALGLFVALPHLLTLWIGGLGQNGFDITSIWFHAIDGAIKVFLFVAYLWIISRFGEIKRVFEYHGAEHKSIFCFEAGQELTVANATGFPRLHPRCGTAFLLVVMVISIVLFAVALPMLPRLAQAAWLNQTLLILIKIGLFFPIAGISYEVIKQAGKRGGKGFWGMMLWPGLQLQKLTTREPSPEQVEIALAALREAVNARAHEGSSIRVL